MLIWLEIYVIDRYAEHFGRVESPWMCRDHPLDTLDTMDIQ